MNYERFQLIKQALSFRSPYEHQYVIYDILRDVEVGVVSLFSPPTNYLHQDLEQKFKQEIDQKISDHLASEAIFSGELKVTL